MNSHHIVHDQNFYTPGVMPSHGIGVTGNKIIISKGETQKINTALGEPSKKEKGKTKGLSKTGNFINQLKSN